MLVRDDKYDDASLEAAEVEIESVEDEDTAENQKEW
jgi:hypothetical protein